jgi:F420 biosynthesis protein FbiB-like protein
MNEYHKFLRTRRSIRSFKDRTIGKSTLDRILNTVLHAPSARNRQPWQLVVLSENKIKTILADAVTEVFKKDLQNEGRSGEQIKQQLERTRSRILCAPVVIILCLNSNLIDKLENTSRQAAENHMAIQSVALCGFQLLLAAHAEGLGAVWTCGPLFAPQAIRNCLNLPEEWQPQAMIFMGHPDEEPEVKRLRDMDEVITYIE